MKSNALLRTNVGLTTNVKLMVGSTYSLYLDSISSISDLSESRYKKIQFNKNNYWDELLPYFYKNTPVDIAYHVKFDNDVDNMGSDFDKQYDDLYQYGARNIIDNRDYDEDYEFFAPLHISKGNLPTNFVVFRLDGAGLNILDKTNFKTEVLDKLKCVKVFDMTRKSNLGEWLDTNITRNKSFPLCPLYMDFRRMEFSSWFGIDFQDGGYSEKAFMLDSTLEFENTYHDFEKFIYDGFKNNKVIYPNIINFSFLFNDTPATPTSLRRWSINRYMGFYLDNLELVTYVSPYLLPSVKSDVIIDENNILYSESGGSPFDDNWKKVDFPYIEIGGEFYKVGTYVESQNTKVSKVKTSATTYSDQSVQLEVTKYKIISNILLTGRQSEINRNLIYIESDNIGSKIRYYNGNPFDINGFEDADVWMIEIDGVYHNIIKRDGEYYLNTDYAFSQSINKFDYYINDPDPNYRKSINLSVDSENPPKKFGLYKCSFTDIKDFDTDIIDTDYSKHEYIKPTQLTQTDETKMYVTNYESPAYPKDINDYKINGSVVNIPAASEYTANSETFRLVDGDLSTLWRKNPVRAKFGFMGSISSNDYPYLLNNNFQSEDFNRTVNTFDPQPYRHERNLDYFISINSSSTEYSHHSLHVEDVENGNINMSFKFELDKYLGIGYNLDYFSYFFGKKAYFDSGNIVTNTKKWSYFNVGDNTIPNISLYRGLKFKIYDVDGVKITNGQIETINIKTSNKYDNYKLSILLSKNEYSVNSSSTDLNIAQVSRMDNVLKWDTIDQWKHDKIYSTNSVVKWFDMLYQTSVTSQIIDPNINPHISSDWSLFTQFNLTNYPTIFWSPSFSGINATGSNNMESLPGSCPPLVYNSGEYYYSQGISGNNFWTPGYTYSVDDVVLFNNNVWVSVTGSNISIPSLNGDGSRYWNISPTHSTIWNIVELWKYDKSYDDTNYTWNSPIFDRGHYVVYEDVVWGTTQSPSPSVIPPNDSKWFRVYSLLPDTNYQYGNVISSNNLIEMNNRLYWCIDNQPSVIDTNIQLNKTLENGINIYVNRKFKNVLVNIYINDNTYDKLSNVDRDDLYTDIYSKITASNFINSINDLSNKYDFSDNIRYIVVNEDSTISIYDFNNLNSVSKLPVLIKCEGPDEFLTRIKSNNVKVVTLSSSELKPKRKLDSGNIMSIDQINWYSDIHLATSIERTRVDQTIIPNYSSLTNNVYNTMYRHSGPYSPIFSEVSLFKAPSATQSYGNYKFDTDLTYFGMIRERVVSKVNRYKNVLKLRNNPNIKSVYPMVDEYGYHLTDFYIFKSTWDFEYYVECSEVPQLPPVVANQSLAYISVNNNTNNNNLTLL